MKNIRFILLIFFLAIYIVGIGVGSIKQVKNEKQDEMYAYLEEAVSGYEVTAGDSIKSVAKDNAKLLLVTLIGGLFVVGPIAVCIVIFLKGYMAGFAIMAVLRLYGISGLLICGANIISAVVLIPAILYYASASSENIIYSRREKKRFLKKYFFLAIFITAIFCADTLLRGFLSSIFMNFGEIMAKNV